MLWKLLFNPHRFMENKKLLEGAGEHGQKVKGQEEELIGEKIKAKTLFMLIKLI